MTYGKLVYSQGIGPKHRPTQVAVSTSVSASPSDPVFTTRRDRRVRRWVTLIATLLLTLVVLAIVRVQGFVSGREFSPSHFQQRKFSFYEIPVLHLQITPIRRSGTTPSTATYLRQNGLITPDSGEPTDWHLVSISRGLTGTTPADADLLMTQLALQSGGDDYWRKWSKDYPALAKVLWPVIQRLAKRELYVLMPALFELAQFDQPADQLQAQIDQYLQTQYAQLISDMETANRTGLARSLLEEARQDYPQATEFRQLQLPGATGL